MAVKTKLTPAQEIEALKKENSRLQINFNLAAYDALDLFQMNSELKAERPLLIEQVDLLEDGSGPHWEVGTTLSTNNTRTDLLISPTIRGAEII